MAKAKEETVVNINDDPVLKDIAAKFRGIKDERKLLTEEAAAQRERLTDMSIQPAAFMLAMRIADLEDQASKNQYMSSFSKSWKALSAEGQMDWIDGEVPAPPADAESDNKGDL